MNIHQIKINMDVKTKQRIESAAMEKQLSVDEYVLAAVQRQLADDGQLQPDQVEPMQRPIYDVDLLQKLDKLHAAILERRNGEPIDVDTFIDLVRDERDAELLGLR
jgi:hypothetical protein